MPLKEKDYTNDEGLKDKSLLLDEQEEYDIKIKKQIDVIRRMKENE